MAVVALNLAGCQKPFVPTVTAPDVLVTKAQVENVPVTAEWIGTVQGMVTANISAKVQGYVLSKDYKEGSTVKAGQVLFQLDPRLYQAALDQAKGQLAEAQAKLGKTQLDVKRFTPLAAESAISQQELDDAIQANLANEAAVEAGQAAVESAQVNLLYCTISSPIDGTAGIANAQVGDLVGPSTAQSLTTVSTVDPVRVYFPVTEQAYIAYANMQAQLKRTVETPDPQFSLHLYLANGAEYPISGNFYFANRQVDTTTGTLMVAGLFANPDFILRPGMYARVKAVTHVLPNALVVPQAAVMTVQGTYQLGVVGPDDKLEIRTVKVGEKSGQDWVITSGITANDTVVVSGAQKLPEGTVVKMSPYVPTVATGADAEPAETKDATPEPATGNTTTTPAAPAGG